MQLIHKESKNLLTPLRVALDFEDTLAEGFVHVFLNTIICGDFFHLMQVNVKKICQFHLQELETNVINGVQELFYTTSKSEFNVGVANFLTDMDVCAPTYATYFKCIWLTHYEPERWMSFRRLSMAPTGRVFVFFCCVMPVTHWQVRCPLRESSPLRRSNT
jgi:hypothetical protein